MWSWFLGLVLSAFAVPAFAAGFTVTSPDIKNGGMVPMAQVFTGCKGGNQSPALSWSGEPAGTQSFAVTMYDPDAPTGSGWWHWTVFNIPANVHGLAANAGAADGGGLPPGAAMGKSDFGFSNYGGPCPPAGPAHHYVITVYALKVPTLSLNAGSSGAKVGSSLHVNALGEAMVTGIFGTN
jgi:Raf kinase inhibitor-like YbhB/YbcL family protein